MTLAFVCDAKFNVDGQKRFCNMIDFNMISKFREYFDSIIVIGRDSVSQPDFVPLNISGVTVITVPRITTLPLTACSITKKKIAGAVSKSNAVYCRNFNGIIAQKEAEKCGIPTVTYLGGSYYDSMRSIGNVFMKIAAPFVQRAFQKSVLKSDNVIYCSPHLQKEYPAKGNTFVWTAAKLETCDSSVREARLNQSLQNKDEVKIALIGQISNNVKGIDTAIRALTLLPDRYTLHILGKGDAGKWTPLATSLGVSDRIHFCGCLPGGKEVFNWLDTKDIYIQPSRTEGLPKAALEAMSRGLPVISSGIGGLADITYPSLIIPPEEYKGLSYAVKSLAENDKLYTDMSLYSFNTSDNYTLPVLDKIFEDICLSLKGENV